MAERRDKTDSSTTRKRALVSCDRCKLRRARCIRNSPDEPCADCKLSGVHCESKLPRKQRVYGSVETLSLRYRALESLVKGLFPSDNIQDVNVLFKIAAAHNIPMPASDDYTPADIFNANAPQQPQLQPQQESAPPQLTQPVQSHVQAPQTSAGSVLPTSAASPTSTSTKEAQNNPFVETSAPPNHLEELIPTRHGVPHYFGPSSSFRLATTIRALVARYKVVAGADFPHLRTSLSQSRTPSRSGRSINRSSANPSDEEYTGLDTGVLPDHDRRGMKRSRAQMEETGGQWEHRSGAKSIASIGDLLPSRSLADALVSAYFDHIHIYLPLFHRSMFQFRLEATYSRKTELLSDIPDIGWLISLALVFAFGCQQLQEHDPEQANKLRLKYLSFAKTYFRHLLTTTSLSNIQALVLLNIHHHTVGQKSSSWLLIGLAARMAITMGMHRDGPNMEFDPIERNIRRQVFWSIYTFEKILCSILGRPTVIDDRETSMQSPDPPMLEHSTMSAEFMKIGANLIRTSYSIRQQAYFDEATGRERSPTFAVAESLLRDCDTFYVSIPAHLSVNTSSVPNDQRARILLLHVYYLYTRCIVSRDFLIQKVEKSICFLERKPISYPDNWQNILNLSEDCVESAHKSIQCIIAAWEYSIIGYSWLDLFFVFHSVLIVCADFLARPKDQQDSPRDIERKNTVRVMLGHVRGMRQVAPTYKILNQVASQFAHITGILDESHTPHDFSAQQMSQEQQGAFGGDESGEGLMEISSMQEDCFANATTNLGLDFFDLNPASRPPPGALQPGGYPGYLGPSTTTEVDDWTARTLKGMHSI
ncbi:hypothetical protein ACN47E_000555 [Coniothyrium glycines]